MARMSSKGQVTIPKAIRDHLGLDQGDRLTFQIRESGEVVLEPEVVDITALKGMLPGPAQPVSIEEMEEAILSGARGE